MQTIQYSEIPPHLREGEFFKSLDLEAEEEGEIEIRADCFKSDSHVGDLKEFTDLLRVSIFWALDSIPESIFNFCYHMDASIWQDIVVSLDLPGMKESPLLNALLAAFEDNHLFELGRIIDTNRWDLIHFAIKHMDLEQVEDRNATVTTKAAGLGNVRVLQLLHERGFPWHELTCTCASFHGKLDCLRYAHEHGCAWDVEVYKAAIYADHMHIMEYAHQTGLPWSSEVSCVAAMEGRLNYLQYLHEQGCPWDAQVCERAAEHGHLSCLEYARNHQCPWDANATLAAAKFGHTHCLEYLLRHQAPVHEHAGEAASYNGHTECLELLFEYYALVDQLPTFWNAKLTKSAAYRADITCLKFLYEHGCPWDASTLDVAAQMGNIDTLQYAMDNDCERSDQIVQFTASSGSLQCLQYLIEEKNLYMDENGSVFVFALLRGDVACVQYLIDRDCPFNSAIFGAEADFEFELDDFYCTDEGADLISCVKLAVDRGFCLNQELVDFMYSRDYENCREYLMDEGWKESTTIAV